MLPSADEIHHEVHEGHEENQTGTRMTQIITDLKTLWPINRISWHGSICHRQIDPFMLFMAFMVIFI
jgi:hypothetical protein